MTRNKIMDVEEAIDVVLDRDTVVVGGFVGIGFPEHLAAALERRFLATGSPRDLTLIFAAGQGDGKDRGLNRLGHPGMVRRVIGGHWRLVPALGELVAAEQVEAYCLPMGMITHWFRDIAGGRAGAISQVGLGTFVDPRIDGGRLNARTTEDIVELIELGGQEHLFLPAMPFNVALLRGTTADIEGNVTLEREAVTLDTLSIAQATKNSGGLVIVQVERTTTHRNLSPRAVRIPGILVDAVVVSPPEHHLQTFAEAYNAAYTGEIRVSSRSIPSIHLSPRKIIARRAVMFLRPDAIVNLGIGVPEGVASVASEEGILDLVTLTVEAGGIGGIPAGGLSFGATANPQAIIDMPYQFDFYDGGGLQQAFLGLAEVDAQGNVNVSRFGSSIAGAGGFINISQATRQVYFLGLFRAGARLEVEGGLLRVAQEGGHAKFIERVHHVTFNGRLALRRGQIIHYITERCVFRLTEQGLEIIEIAPGLDLERDVLAAMDFTPTVSPRLAVMDSAIFRPGRMGLLDRPPVALDDRLEFRPEDNILFCDFEGLVLRTLEEASALARRVDEQFQAIGHGVNVITNYDSFEVHPQAERAFFDMIKNTAQYVLTRTDYSTNTFLRRRLGERFTAAGVEPHLHASLADARAGVLDR